MKNFRYFNKKLILYFLVLFFPVIIFATDLSNLNPLIEIPNHKLTLNFEDVKIRTALQLLSEFSGYNLIVDDKIKGHLTLHLDNMPWQQALDLILETQGLSKRAIPNGWFITTESEALRLKKQRLEMQIQQKNSVPLLYKFLQIRYGEASDVATILKDKNNSLLSPQGSVFIDKRTNSLWIRDSQHKLLQIEAVIKKLDRPTQQISIEARVVSIDRSKKKDLGIHFGLTLPPTHSVVPSNSKVHGKTGDDTSTLSYLTMDLPIATENSTGEGGLSLGLNLIRLGRHALLDLELSALESEGGAQVISTPHLITADQQPAYIETGEDIPYQGKAADGSVNIVFKKAVLALKVTPKIMPGRQLMLDLAVNQDQPSNFTVLNVPAIKARGIKTQVMLKSGETVVLGGIHEHTQSQSTQRVPFLGTLPIIGPLFQYKTNSDALNELLIFVTPTILDP